MPGTPFPDWRTVVKRRDRFGGIPDEVFVDEAVRMLRSSISFALSGVDNPILAITSSNPSEGKTTTCVNLALSFAEAGKRVVILDLDLRHPNVARTLGHPNSPGYSDLLQGGVAAADCLQNHTFLDRAGNERAYYFCGTGTAVANSAEILAGPRTARLLDRLASQCDILLIDSAPILPVADTLSVAKHATGTILVVESGKTSIEAASRSKDLLIRNQTRILGVVLNKVPNDDRGMSKYQGAYGRYYQVPDTAVIPETETEADTETHFVG